MEKIYNVTICGNTYEEFLTDLQNALEWATANREALIQHGEAIAEALEYCGDEGMTEEFKRRVEAGNAWVQAHGGQEIEEEEEEEEDILANLDRLAAYWHN